MAVVALEQLWVHDAEDPSDYLRFYTSDRSDSSEIPGEVRRYAAGRLRTITRVGEAQNIGATLRLVSDTDLEQLKTWLGALLLVRDHRGRLMFGTYFKLAVVDYEDRSGYDVTVTFQQVTRSIEV